MDGKTHWLWCFANADLSDFLIDRSRGHPALLKFFTQEFGGVWVSDSWAADNAVSCVLRRLRDELPAETCASQRKRLTARLDELIKRLRRHRLELFTFLDHKPESPSKKMAEQSIRPAVIIRKNSYGNRSVKGADVQAILTSIFFTLKKRGHNPIQTLYTALATYLKTNKLPPLPPQATPCG